MIEFRFKANSTSKAIEVLNSYAPDGKQWRCDRYTGEHWIKIKQDENTQTFNNYLKFFLELHSSYHTLNISDCSTKATLSIKNTPRPALF